MKLRIGYKSLKQIKNFCVIKIANFPMPGHWRWHILKHAGIKFNIPNDGRRIFIYIGEDVKFDTVFPEEIEIGNYVHITTGCILLTHQYNH